MTKQKEIRWGQVASITNPQERNRVLSQELMEVGDNLMLSDCLANLGMGGQQVLILLDNQSKSGRQRLFKLRCLRDQWGQPVLPGDKVEWKQGIKRFDEYGNKFTKGKMDAIRQGGHERDPLIGFEEWGEAIVDKTGCITVPYKDAISLLRQFGVHYNSGYSFGKAHETSKDPIKVRMPDYSIKERILHYWRFEEVRMTDRPKPIDTPDTTPDNKTIN